MKKFFAILVAFALVLPCFAAAPKTKVGVCMPTKDAQRWNQDGANMKAMLEEAGYTVDLQYANNDVATQVSQIENMVTGGCSVIVIGSIDGSALKAALDNAKRKKVAVVSYDRLIMNSNAVSYYATFDNYKVGVMMAEYLVDKLNLKERTKDDPAYIEYFTGSPDDNNCVFLWNGSMDVFKPYIDSGVLVCRSGQTSKAQCSTLRWATEEAQNRMENLIASNGYGPRGTRLDAVLSHADIVSMGVTNALVAAGYTKANFPIITGQDADIAAVKNVLKGTQAMTIFKDTRTLAEKTVTMVDALMKNTKPEVNDTKSYNNGTGIIPSYLCDPVIVEPSNYKEILVDSGYYTDAQLNN